MLRLNRVVLIATSLMIAGSALAQTTWKESGWISTCAGIGCTGQRAICATYTHSNSEGAKVTEYCYLDP